MKTHLFGDGIHLDTEAIQEMLDSGCPIVALPVPEVCYLIDKPLKIHSFQELSVPRFCTIKLRNGSNCHMLENADYSGGNRDIKISGGIWDFNNMGQAPNPISFGEQTYKAEGSVWEFDDTGASPDVVALPGDSLDQYDGQAFYFQNVKELTLSNMTFKDPSTYGCTLDTVSYFTIENIVFDYNLGNPRPVNMDGIHLNGNCHYGAIRNLKGRCYDDMVALNAEEGSNGPITHIDIDGIYADDCHSAVRLLTVTNEVSYVHIHNLHGTFYQYGVGLTKYYEGENTGYFEAIVLDNLHISKAVRYSYLHLSEEFALKSYVYPLIYIEDEAKIRNMSISELYRIERNVPVSTIYVGKNAEIENLSLANIYNENLTGEEIMLLDNQGTIQHLEQSNIRTIEGR